jgi:hypothetical protein
MKTQLTNFQRRQLRDYISAVGVGKAPVLLRILSEMVDADDFELLTTCVVTSIFDSRTPRQTTEFLRERGICVADILRAFKAVLASVQGPQFVHGWN